jgi:hypothetical protein
MTHTLYIGPLNHQSNDAAATDYNQTILSRGLCGRNVVVVKNNNAHYNPIMGLFWLTAASAFVYLGITREIPAFVKTGDALWLAELILTGAATLSCLGRADYYLSNETPYVY